MKNNYAKLIFTAIICFMVGYTIHDNTISVTISGEDLGPVSEWISAALSAISIYFVYWQVNKQITKEKDAKKELSRPIFSFNVIFRFHNNIKTYVSSKVDIDDISNIDKSNIELIGNTVRYRSLTSNLNYLNKIFYITNPSTHPMLFIRIEFFFDGENEKHRNEETFWIGRINENETIQILPHNFVNKIMQGKYVNKYVNDGIGIKKIKLFFTTALGEKFFYLYKYQHNDIEIVEKRKVLEKDYYDKYLFDQNPYIFFDDKYIKEKK